VKCVPEPLIPRTPHLLSICEYFGDETLLDTCFLYAVSGCRATGIVADVYKLGVELRQPWLARIVEDQYCIDHFFQCQTCLP